MASVVEIVAILKDQASASLKGLGLNLQDLAHKGLAPIAQVSPTAAKGLESMLAAAGPTGLAVTALAGASVAVVGGLAALAKSTADQGAHLLEMSTKTGASVEALSALGVAAKLSGSSLDEAAGAFKFMQNAIDGATQGSEAQIKAFDRLGVSLADLRTLAPDAQFEALAKAVIAVEDPTQRTALALDVFGKKGVELLPVLEDVAQRGMKGVKEEAAALGVLMGTDLAKAGDQFGDQLDRLGFATQGLGQIIGAAILPAMQSFADGALEAVKAVIEFERSTGVLTLAAQAVGLALQGVGVVVSGLITSLKLVADLIGMVLGPAWEGLKFIVGEAAKGLGLAAEETKTAGDEAAKAAPKVDGLARSASEAAKAFKAMEESTKPALEAVRALGPGFEDIAKKLEILQAGFTNLKAIDALKKLRDEGELTASEFGRAVDAIDAKMRALETGTQETTAAVTTLGTEGVRAMTATTAAAAETTVQVEALKTATETTAESMTRLFGISAGPLLDTLTMLIDKGKALQDQAEGTSESLREMTEIQTFRGAGSGAAPTGGGGGGGGGGGRRYYSSSGSGADNIVAPLRRVGPPPSSAAGGGGGSVTEYNAPAPGSGYSPSQEYINSYQRGGIHPGSGTRPELAFIHPREMVLPPELSEALWAMARGGGSGPSGTERVRLVSQVAQVIYAVPPPSYADRIRQDQDAARRTQYAIQELERREQRAS